MRISVEKIPLTMNADKFGTTAKGACYHSAMPSSSRLPLALLALLCAGTNSASAEPPPAAAASLFVYEEDGDTITFFPPSTVEFVRASASKAQPCRGELPEHGNMWRGAEVVRAFRDDAVKNALAGSRAPYAAEYAGRLRAGDASIIWASACKKCQHQSPALKQLQDILHTVMRNRRLVCQPKADGAAP